jgi:excisionase family DNA binding protein
MQPQPETQTSSADQGHDRLISKSQAANLLGVSTRTVDRICSEGSLEKVFLRGSVRFRLLDIQAIVQSGI